MLAVRAAFLAAALAAFAGATVFLYRRLVRDVTARPALRRLGAALLGLGFFGVAAARPLLRAGEVGRTASLLLLGCWGVLLHTLLVLVAMEAVRAVARRRGAEAPADPARREFLARAAAASALAAGGGVSAFGAYRALTPPELTEVPVRLPGLPRALDGFTVVQLSDVHVGPVIQERFMDALVEVANRARPDLVAITGDLVDAAPERIGRAVARVAGLKARYGTWFVSGNHEFYAGWERWAPELERLGVRVLRNERATIGDAGGAFDLLGVEDWGMGRGRESRYDLAAALRGRDLERASVLLAHQPANLEAVAAAGVGLQLSGHTHGGQLFPGTAVASALWGPAAAGLSRHGALWQFTSRGCGFVGPPMRVGAPPEVVKLVLLAG